MHMISKKDLKYVEMDTLTKLCSPTTVITSNREVQTHEEATVHVKELVIFLTMKILEGTQVVLSFGKLCDEHGCSYEWINGQKPHQCNTENFVPIVIPDLSTSSSSSSHLSTSMTSLRQESHHSTSISCSSSSPIATASSDREIRHKEDQSGIDSPPVHFHQKPTFIKNPLSCQVQMLMTERGNPLFAVKPITSAP